MRISDWSSDVCSSDLFAHLALEPALDRVVEALPRHAVGEVVLAGEPFVGDRKSVVWGKSVSVRVDLGGRRSIKKKNNITLSAVSVILITTQYTTQTSSILICANCMNTRRRQER